MEEDWLSGLRKGDGDGDDSNDDASDSNDEGSWSDDFSRSSRKFLKEGSEYTREKLKLASETADHYSQVAFKNLRRTVLEIIMSEGVSNSASRKVRRQAIAAVLGEEAWKELEGLYDIVGPAWDDADAVTRALAAIELAGSSTPNDQDEAWQQISSSSLSSIPTVPDRVQWLGEQGYITDRSISLSDPVAKALTTAYICLTVIIAIVAFIWLLKFYSWLWTWKWYGDIYEEFEETPPHKRKRKPNITPKWESKRLKKFEFEVRRPVPKQSTIVAHNGGYDPQWGNASQLKQNPQSRAYYPTDSQYTDDETQELYDLSQTEDPELAGYDADPNNGVPLHTQVEGEVNEEVVERGYDEQGYSEGDYNEALDEDYLPPQESAAVANDSIQIYDEKEARHYNNQQYRQGGSQTEHRQQREPYEDDELSIVESEVPQANAAKQHYSIVSVSKAGQSSKGSGNVTSRPATRTNRAQQTVPSRRRR